jgi:hypothetical protein
MNTTFTNLDKNSQRAVEMIFKSTIASFRANKEMPTAIRKPIIRFLCERNGMTWVNDCDKLLDRLLENDEVVAIIKAYK